MQQHILPISCRTTQIIIAALAVLAGIPWFLDFWLYGVLAILGTFLVLKFIESMWIGEHHYSMSAATAMVTETFVLALLAFDVFLPLTME